MGVRNAILALVLLTTATGCQSAQGSGTQPDDRFTCPLQDKAVQTSLAFRGYALQVGGSVTRSTAVRYDPVTDTRTYIATLVDEVNVGRAPTTTRLGVPTRRWLRNFAADLDAKVGAAASVGFVYERASRQDAEQIIGRAIPPDGWNAMIVNLGPDATASATLSVDERASIDAGVAATARVYLTLYDNGEFSITHGWSGTLRSGAQAQAWIRERVGLGTGDDWSTSIATEYEIRFGADLQPRLLIATGEASRGSRLHKTTRVLDLTDEQNRSIFRRSFSGYDPFTNPFNGWSGRQLFFLNQDSRLWPRLIEGVSVTTNYEVDSTDFVLDIGPFGVGYSSQDTSRQLIDMIVDGPNGSRTINCSGRPDHPALEHAPKLQPVPASRLPSPRSTTSAPAPPPSAVPKPPTPTSTPPPMTTPMSPPLASRETSTRPSPPMVAPAPPAGLYVDVVVPG